MKYIIFTIACTFMPALVPVCALPDLHGKHYDDFELLGFGRLPRFWGQEMVFTPEARHWLARLQAEGYAFYQPSIGAWDVFYDKDASITAEALRDVFITRVGKELREELEAHTSAASLNGHGRDVLQLAMGASPFGVSVLGELNFMVNHAEVLAAHSGDYEAAQSFRGGRPDVLNVSLGDQFRPRALRDALSARTIIVMSAGNKPLKQVYFVSLAGTVPILVGANNPRGEISSYSSSSQVSIYAPSDHLFPDGEVRRGTSYAAPMVTGALADMFAILPPAAITSLSVEPIVPNSAQTIISVHKFLSLVIHMLRETSTPTAMANSNTGGGVLNHYKLLRVAHRIAQQAESGDQSVAQLIEDHHVYDFSAEAQHLYDEAMRLRRTSAANQQEVLFKLREAVALDGHNHTARRELAEMYAQADYTSLREFYAPPAQLQRVRTHMTLDFDGVDLVDFKISLLELYIGELGTPELISKYLDKDLLLAMMWASSGDFDSNIGRMNWLHVMDFYMEEAIKRVDLPADSPWRLFNNMNPLPFIITSYSMDVQQAQQLVDAVLERFGLSAARITLTLPSVTKEFKEFQKVLYGEEVIERSAIEIGTGFLLKNDIDVYISDEMRTARQLPEFAGQPLNLVEWSILHDSSKLFAAHHEQLQSLIADEIIYGYETLDEILAAGDLEAEPLALANKVATELEGHVGFTVKHTDNRVALGGLLDLHQQVSSAAEHLALLQLQLTHKGLRPQLQQILQQKLRRLPGR